MNNIKNKTLFFQHFVIFITFCVLSSCQTNLLIVKKVEGKQVKINEGISNTAEIENFIKPYRDNVDKDMNTVLSVATKIFDKSGKWQSPMGNLMSDATLLQANIVFQKRENKNIDICLLNHGGIRANINKGNVTVRTAFEVMPFENTTIVLALTGTQIEEMANYIIAEKKPHPLAGMYFKINGSNTASNILVQGQPLDLQKTYYVATSDYLATGGDDMKFFKNALASFDLDYKLRNVLIDYFRTVPQLPISQVVRIDAE